MVRFISLLIFGMSFLMVSPIMPKVSNIELSLSPVKEFFILGEPVAVRMVLKNTSSRVLELMLAYPKDLGLTFTCEDKDVISRKVSTYFDRRIPIIKLLPNQKYEVIIALNRYLDFKKPKRYAIKYYAEYLEPVSTKKPKPKVYSATGHLEVQIKPGILNKEEIRRLQQGLEETDKQKVREAIELLLWVDDPSVIHSLETASRIFPETGIDVIEALRKFGSIDRAKSAVLSIAKYGDMAALQAAFRLFTDLTIVAPDDFYKQLLNSKDSGKRFTTLEYLLKHGSARYLPLIRPMKNDSNPNIVSLAEKFITKFEKQK